MLCEVKSLNAQEAVYFVPRPRCAIFEPAARTPAPARAPRTCSKPSSSSLPSSEDTALWHFQIPTGHPGTPHGRRNPITTSSQHPRPSCLSSCGRLRLDSLFFLSRNLNCRRHLKAAAPPAPTRQACSSCCHETLPALAAAPHALGELSPTSAATRRCCVGGGRDARWHWPSSPLCFCWPRL